MGSWGESSMECDDVQDLMDDFTFKGGMHRVLGKVRVDAYNPTQRVGIVLCLLDVKQEVPVEVVQKAILDAKAALMNETYLKSWRNMAKREKELKLEVRRLQRYVQKEKKS